MKILNQRKQSGYKVLSLKYAGDVIMQSNKQACFKVEQILEDRNARDLEQQYASTSCKQIINYIGDELKTYKQETLKLKEECDKLKSAYQDIIEKFAKMQELQSQVLLPYVQQGHRIDNQQKQLRQSQQSKQNTQYTQ